MRRVSSSLSLKLAHIFSIRDVHFKHEGGVNLRHLMALAIKLVSSFVLLWLIMGGIYDLSVGDIFTISFVLGFVSYIVGDLLILRFTNNTIATIADFGLALFVIWLMAENMTPIDDLFTASLIAAAGVAVFEYFFHKYVQNNVLEDHHDETTQVPGHFRYQTETSEEITDINRKEK